jgi:hypothetical protein
LKRPDLKLKEWETAMKQKRARTRSDAVGYRRPPTKYQFRKGQNGNPSGKRKRPPSPPDLKAQLKANSTRE